MCWVGPVWGASYTATSAGVVAGAAEVDDAACCAASSDLQCVDLSINDACMLEIRDAKPRTCCYLGFGKHSSAKENELRMS